MSKTEQKWEAVVERLTKSEKALRAEVRILKAEVETWKQSAYVCQKGEAGYADEARQRGLELARVKEERDRLAQSSAYFERKSSMADNRFEEMRAELQKASRERDAFQQASLGQSERIAQLYNSIRVEQRNVEFLKSRVSQLKNENLGAPVSDPERVRWRQQVWGHTRIVRLYRERIERMRRDMNNYSFVKARLLKMEQDLLDGRNPQPTPVYTGSFPTPSPAVPEVVQADLFKVEERVMKIITEVEQRMLRVISWRTRKPVGKKNKLTSKKKKR